MRIKQGVVIGAGLAGLMAARVLADHCESVLVIEKDELTGPEPRKGVPQGNHIHLLWSVGSTILENLFPGLFEDLAAAGGVAFDNSADMRWYHGGVWKMKMDSGLRIYSQSRPLLEYQVRQKLLQHDNVQFERAAATGIRVANGQVNGIGIRTSDGTESDIAAELVVDASGRAAKLPKWLASHGYSKPETQELDVNLRYASRLYERKSEQDWQCMAVYARPSSSKKYGVIFPIEGNRWIVTFGGCFGDHPATDEEGFLEFARSLEQPDIYQAIRDAKPLSDISGYQYLTEIWRRYDKQRDLPGGLVVLGDALCSFNPLYGQGMTVAALEAMALDQCLRAKSSLRSYYAESTKIIRNPWMLATGNDLLYPDASGKRPFWVGPLGRYTDRVLRLSANHPRVNQSFLNVLHLAKPPSHLFRPDILAAVMFSPQANARPE
jgi:flavin-dependent dehydrogenase